MRSLGAGLAGALLLVALQANAEPITLAQAQSYALQHEPEIAAARLRAAASKQNREIASSAYLPQVSGSVVGVQTRENSIIAAGNGLGSSSVLPRGSAGISVSQMITDFGRTDDLVQAAELEADAEASRASAREIGILLQVTESFYDVLRAREVINITSATFDNRKLLLQRIQTLAKANLKSSLDVSLAEQSSEEARLDDMRARAAYQDALVSLREAMGDTTGREINPVDDTPLVAPPDDVQALEQQAKDRNPDLRSYRKEADSEARLASAEDRDWYPTVQGLGVIGATPLRDPNHKLNDTYNAFGVNVSIPIFTGGRFEALGQRAHLEAQSADREYENQVGRVLRDVDLFWSAARTDYESLPVLEKIKKNSADVLEFVQLGYNNGRNSIIDLNASELAKTTADINYTVALNRYKIRLAALDALVGQPALRP